jgi:integrase
MCHSLRKRYGNGWLETQSEMVNKRKRITFDKVSIVQRGKKGKWVAEFHWRGSHCRKALDTRRLKTARKLAARIETALQEGTYGSSCGTKKSPVRSNCEMRVTTAVEEFVKYKEVEGKRRKTIIKYRSTLKLFCSFCDQRGISSIADVSLRHCDAFRAQRAAGVAAKTLHNDLVMLKTFLDWVAKRKLITENPLAGETFLKPRYRPRGGPTLEQVNQILAHLKGARRVAVAILAFTGMRSGELQRLNSSRDVDLQGNWIHIVSRPGRETKSGHTWKVPIHRRLRKLLEDLPKSTGDYRFSENASRKYPSGGHQLNMKRLNEQFQQVLRKLGIPAGKKNNGFTLHSLRSFFKTFCVNSGIPREVVDTWQDHVGDRRPTASDAYYRLTDEESQRQMSRVPFGD